MSSAFKSMVQPNQFKALLNSINEFQENFSLSMCALEDEPSLCFGYNDCQRNPTLFVGTAQCNGTYLSECIKEAGKFCSETHALLFESIYHPTQYSWPEGSLYCCVAIKVYDAKRIPRFSKLERCQSTSSMHSINFSALLLITPNGGYSLRIRTASAKFEIPLNGIQVFYADYHFTKFKVVPSATCNCETQKSIQILYCRSNEINDTVEGILALC